MSHTNQTNKTPKQSQKFAIKSIAITLVAAIIAIGTYLMLPFDDVANKGLSLTLFIGILWMTEAIHITATSVLIPVLGVLIGLPDFDTKKAVLSFSDPLIFVYFGGFALAAALHAHELDKKIAYGMINLVGGHLGRAVLMIFLVTAGLSMWISNTATAAMILPLAMGLLNQLDAKTDRKTFVFVLLGVAYSASIGGMGTVVGSPPNAIAAKELGLDFMGWLKVGLPMTIILMPALLGAMYFVLKPNLNQKINQANQITLPWTPMRVATMTVFVCTALGWMFSRQLGAYFNINNPDTLIGILAVVMVMLLGLVSWKQVSDNTDWGVLLLVGGGITLSNIMKDSGGSLAIGEQISGMLANAPIFVVVLGVATFIIFLTEITSNTASAALFAPLFATIAVQLGMPPQALVLIIGIGASCAFMLPVATPPNALVMSTGHIQQKEMMKVGFVLNIVSIIIVAVLAYVFLI